MAKLYGYPLMVKQLQDEMLRLYENSDGKDFALMKALARKKLTVIEKFTDLDRELLINYQTLLYYKSKIPDILLSFSLEPEKNDEVYKIISKINLAVNQVENVVKDLKESEVYKEFFEKEREKRRTRQKNKKSVAPAQKENKEVKEEKKEDTKNTEVDKQDEQQADQQTVKEDNLKVEF